ncbi:hypothetical protein L7F22_041060 [Adiantum nelumboides]|nr:hypothetical protein [Adiantum nelumboides]
MPQASLNENSTVSQAQAAKANGKATKRKSHNIEEVVVDSQAQEAKSIQKKVVVDLGDEEDDDKGKDFDKDSEGCRKKFQVVLAQYKIDKTHNIISSNDKRHTCRWYNVIDEYYHDQATSIPLSHASSITQDDPMDPGEGESTKDHEKPPFFIASKKGTTPKYEESIAQMADTGKDLLEYLKDSSNCQDALEREHLTLMAGMHECMKGYLKHAESQDN